MRVRAPVGYLSLHDAQDLLMLEMHDGLAPSETCLVEDVATVDAKQAMAAANSLRQAILAEVLDLFALFSSRDKPTRLHNQTLIQAACFAPNSMVLTFCYVDRRPGAPFGLSWPDLTELTRDPLCLEKKAFRKWLKREARKKVWPCHGAKVEARRPRGRPSKLDEAVEVIKQLKADGEITLIMRTKEVHALVQKARPSLNSISPETVRRARQQAGQKKIRPRPAEPGR